MKKLLKNKTVVVTGSTRGIGHAIALRAAQDGANIVIVGKTDTPSDKLPGTIHTAAQDMIDAGGQSIAVQCDVRDEAQVKSVFEQAVKAFGGIDILVNNASAIIQTTTIATEMKRFDLMQGVNARGTFLCSMLAHEYLQAAENPHILNLSPPLNLNAKWFAAHLAYTMAKYGMSMCTLGMSEEFRPQGIAVNSLWPVSIIATAAIEKIGGDALMKRSRKPEIMAEAAYWILTQPAGEVTGNFFLDTDVLARAGVTDLSKYAVDPAKELYPDIFLDDPFGKAQLPASGSTFATTQN